MSFAAFTVPMYGSRAAALRAHSAAYSLLSEITVASCAALAGSPLTAK